MSEAIYCYDTASVRFAIYPRGRSEPRFVAEIAEDPLRDLFGASGGGDSLVRAYQAHAPSIDARALERYLAAPGKPVRLLTQHFEMSEQGDDACADLRSTA